MSSAKVENRGPAWSTLDPALKLQRIEEKLCTCGAAGSGESHCDWCEAEKFDRIPKTMSAANALKRLGYS